MKIFLDCEFNGFGGSLISVGMVSEGGGEACYTVLKAGDQYYRIDYSYYSYNGYETDYAEVYLVTPVERMVTFYE